MREIEQPVVASAETFRQVATHVEGVGAVEAGHPVPRVPRLAAEVPRRVDHHRANAFLLDLAGHALGFEQRLLAEEADVAAAVTDQHQERVDLGISQALGLDQFQAGHQSVGQRCGASDAEPFQAALGEVHARSRAQDDAGIAPAEGDECDLIATDIGMPE